MATTEKDDNFMINWELQKLLKAGIEQQYVTVDLAGHCRVSRLGKHHADERRQVAEAIYMGVRDFPVEKSKALIEVLRTMPNRAIHPGENPHPGLGSSHTVINEQQERVLVPVAESGPEYIPMRSSCLYQCYECGKDIKLATNGSEVICVNPCAYPNGIGPIVTEINIPSGQFVAANDLRELFPVVGDFSINHIIGMKLTAEQYAEQGMAHGFVGNTCPSVWRRLNKKKPNSSFVIGSGAYNRKTDEAKPIRYHESVANICTDLWWYSIADYEDYMRRQTAVNFDEVAVDDYEDAVSKALDAFGAEAVSCRPGVYRFTHLTHMMDRDDYAHERIYAKFEWVREPDPVVRDTKAEYESMDYTAGQVVGLCLGEFDYRDHDDDDKSPSPHDLRVQRVVDHLMCTIGGGVDWHPNGWGCWRPGLNVNTPEVEIPKFERAYYWYPFSPGYGGLMLGAGLGSEYSGLDREFITLNPSFVELAFNIVRSILVYGIENRMVYPKSVDVFRLDHTKRDRQWLSTGNISVDTARQAQMTIRNAEQALLALAKRYPNQVPADCRSLIPMAQARLDREEAVSVAMEKTLPDTRRMMDDNIRIGDQETKLSTMEKNAKHLDIEALNKIRERIAPKTTPQLDTDDVLSESSVT